MNFNALNGGNKMSRKKIEKEKTLQYFWQMERHYILLTFQKKKIL